MIYLLPKENLAKQINTSRWLQAASLRHKGLNQIIQLIALGGSTLNTTSINLRHGEIIGITGMQTDRFKNIEKGSKLLDMLVERLNSRATFIGINLAFGIDPIYDKDKQLYSGKLFVNTKEHILSELFGEDLVQLLMNKIEILGMKPKIMIVNDIACLLANCELKKYPKLVENISASWRRLDIAHRVDEDNKLTIGAVVGTGFNLGIKLQQKIFNLELGEFNPDDEFLMSYKPLTTPLHNYTHNLEYQNRIWNNQLMWKHIAAKVYNFTSIPSKAKLEKLIAGAYLYLHYNFYAQHAKTGWESIDNTNELNQIADYGVTDRGQVATYILWRAGELLARSVCGLVSTLANLDKSSLTSTQIRDNLNLANFRNQDKNVSITGIDLFAEGSVFWESEVFQDSFQQNLNYLTNKMGVNIDLQPKIEKSYFWGLLPFLPKMN